MAWRDYTIKDESIINSYVHSNLAPFILTYQDMNIENEIEKMLSNDGPLQVEIRDWIGNLKTQEEDLIKQFRSGGIDISSKQELEDLFSNILLDNSVIKFDNLKSNLLKKKKGSVDSIHAYMKQVEQIFNEVSNIINNDNIKKDLLSDKQYKRALTNLKKYNKSSGIKIKNIRDKLDANASNIKEYLLEAKKGRYNLNKFYKEMMETIHYDLGWIYEPIIKNRVTDSIKNELLPKGTKVKVTGAKFMSKKINNVADVVFTLGTSEVGFNIKSQKERYNISRSTTGYYDRINDGNLKFLRYVRNNVTALMDYYVLRGENTVYSSELDKLQLKLISWEEDAAFLATLASALDRLQTNQNKSKGPSNLFIVARDKVILTSRALSQVSRELDKYVLNKEYFKTSNIISAKMYRRTGEYDSLSNYEEKKEFLNDNETRDKSVYNLIYDNFYSGNANTDTIDPLISKVEYTINLTKAKGIKK